MQLLQFSAAKGPAECCLAVSKALTLFLREAAINDIQADILEQEQGDIVNTLCSVLISVEGDGTEHLINRWQGSIQWICQSPYRPKHKRKNWFISVTSLSPLQTIADSAIRFETCKSSGAGGQHVNKTESAVRVIHIATGIAVKVQSERSQHANRKMAMQLLEHKIAQINNDKFKNHKAAQYQVHQLIERGNPIRIFYGEQFTEQFTKQVIE
ncbi:peptide chain release factor H [Orbus mooreae]|uniref:peptide chain release factor H n=1 Tax=Orbus mooreae TaxID=3074107 RepID=UPI00370D6178